MDLESYLTNYTGVTRLKRLAFIASASPALKAEALRLAVDEVKRTTNTAQYAELLAIAGDALKRDDAWVDAEDKKAVHKLERLENELNNHKTSLVKESIRMGHNDLGDFHSERGDFAAALKCYVRTRDYCTTSKHIITMCLNVIRVSVHICATSHPRRQHSLHPLALASHRHLTAHSSSRPGAHGQLHPRRQLHHEGRVDPRHVGRRRAHRAAQGGGGARPPRGQEVQAGGAQVPRGVPRARHLVLRRDVPAGRRHLRRALRARLLRPRRAQGEAHRQLAVPRLPRARPRGVCPPCRRLPPARLHRARSPPYTSTPHP